MDACLSVHIGSIMTSMDPWHLIEKDIAGREDTSSVKCLNCRWKGHSAAECTNPKRADVCYLCGDESHSKQCCTQLLSQPGFKLRHRDKCGLLLSAADELCQRCRRWGHSALACPDIWRQFHNTTDSKALCKIHSEQRRRVFCCICAVEGHFGYECHLVHPKERLCTPLVAQYDFHTSHSGARSSKAVHPKPNVKSSRSFISYKDTQPTHRSSDLSADSHCALHQLSKCTFAACIPMHEDVCRPQFVQPEPWPILWNGQCPHFISFFKSVDFSFFLNTFLSLEFTVLCRQHWYVLPIVFFSSKWC